MSKAVIAVVGSAMIDLTAYATVIPAPGQTLEGDLFTTGFGGKGANQAVIAAHCGAEVHFVGKLGRDLFGDSIAENFKKLGIDSEYVERSDTPNGVAHIWVDANGENRIIIIPGANHEIQFIFHFALGGELRNQHRVGSKGICSNGTFAKASPCAIAHAHFIAFDSTH